MLADSNGILGSQTHKKRGALIDYANIQLWIEMCCYQQGEKAGLVGVTHAIFFATTPPCPHIPKCQKVTQKLLHW